MAQNGRITDGIQPPPYAPPADGWQEVPASEIPPVRNDTYAALVTELVLRLEATPPSKALLKVYPTNRRAGSVQSNVHTWLAKHDLPTNAIILTRRTVDGKGHLYVRRGPAFKQLEIGPDGVVRRWALPEDVES